MIGGNAWNMVSEIHCVHWNNALHTLNQRYAYIKPMLSIYYTNVTHALNQCWAYLTPTLHIHWTNVTHTFMIELTDDIIQHCSLPTLHGVSAIGRAGVAVVYRNKTQLARLLPIKYLSTNQRPLSIGGQISFTNNDGWDGRERIRGRGCEKGGSGKGGVWYGMGERG